MAKTHLPDAAVERMPLVLGAVTWDSFKRVRRFDRHPRRLVGADRLDRREDVLTMLDWGARRWYGFGCEGVINDDSHTFPGGGHPRPAGASTY